MEIFERVTVVKEQLNKYSQTDEPRVKSINVSDDLICSIVLQCSLVYYRKLMMNYIDVDLKI